MKNRQRGFTVIELFIVVTFLVLAVGWGLNIVKLVGMDFATITGLLVLRVIGVVVPFVGGIVGYF